jgi:hypothetical protein
VNGKIASDRGTGNEIGLRRLSQAECSNHMSAIQAACTKEAGAQVPGFVTKNMDRHDSEGHGGVTFMKYLLEICVP